LSSPLRAAKLSRDGASGQRPTGGDEHGDAHRARPHQDQGRSPKGREILRRQFRRDGKAGDPGRGCQLDLAGLQLNVTTIIEAQKHEQHVGIEHIAVETDDYAGALAKLKGNGARILEELFNNGRHVCWVECPDGAQMELIEKV
jgi:hypothetical protein